MQTVLVTGASSGIGEAYVYEYAKRGYQVILVARNKDKLEQTAHELQVRYKVPAYIIVQDLSEQGAAVAVVMQLKHKGIQVDVLVNCAGFATKGRLSDTNLARQYQEINVNITALTEMTHILIADMACRGAGTIINVASAAAFNPVPYSAVYAATKAYVLSFTQSVAYEYAERGIRVIAVCPEATRTHFFDEINHMDAKMREPEDVVRSTFRALKMKKIICTDGKLCWMQSLMPHLLSRTMCLRITGAVGKKIWGK